MRCAYLLGLGLLVLLPVVELGLDLLNNSWDLSLAHWWIDRHGRAVLKNGWWNTELSRSDSWRGSSLLALLSLLSSSSGKVILLVLLDELEALNTGIINSTSRGSSESRWGQKWLRVGSGGWLKVVEQGGCTADLVKVSWLRCLSKDLLGALTLLLVVVCVLLSLLALTELGTSLVLVVLECALLGPMSVLGGTDLLVLGLLLLLELGLLVTESGDVLVSLVLLGLDDIKLSLDLVVLLGAGLGHWVVHGVLELLDLGLDLIDLLLTLLESAERLAKLAQGRDLGKSLLLVNELHLSSIDLLLQSGNLAIDILNTLVVDLAAGNLLLVDARLELLIKLLDLVHGAVAASLVGTLLLADLVLTSLELLASLLLWSQWSIFVGLGGVELGADSILCPVSESTFVGAKVCMEINTYELLHDGLVFSFKLSN